jgi:Spy/CpxP family protein refolding chaperone
LNRRALFLVPLSIMLIMPAFLSAQGGCGRTKCGFGMACLELDPGQHLKMEKLKLEHQLANIDLKAERMELRLKIKEELLKEEPNRKVIEKLAKSIAANGEKMQMNRLDHIFAVRKILKPEQWKHFVERHAGGMWGRRGAMGHCCGDKWGAKGHRCGGAGRMMGKGGMRHMGNPGREGVCPYGEKTETEE